MIPTKILIPRRRDHLLRRPRLVNHLHQHVDRPVTLVSAPAGYGKTSLAVDFSHDAPLPVCWLSLDEADQDFHTFVDYLIAAIHRHFPDFGEPTRRALTANPEAGRNPSALAGVMVQDIVDHVPEFFALVLDDYHTVASNSEINGLIEGLLKYRPEHCHLIIASRTVPQELPIVLLVAREQIAFVGQADLAFTADEIQVLMQQMHNIDLTMTQAEELVAESEGWITGILLSTAAMWRGMRELLTQARTQEGPIYTYLADQVFMKQAAALRDFMLVSSTLPEMNETLCREVLKLDSTENILRKLEQRGAFLAALSDETTDTIWYRYHHLFRDFLQTRLKTQDPERFRQLHKQAADWFEHNEQWESAVSHRLSVGDALATGQTMENGVRSLFMKDRFETIVAWYKAVPESLRPALPRLLLFVARALSNLGQLDKAVPLLIQAETAFIERNEIERALMTTLERANFSHARGDYGEASVLAQEVLARASGLQGPTAEGHRVAGITCLNMGRPEEAVEHLKKSLAGFRELGSTHDIAMTYLDLSFALLRLGRLGEGWVCQDQAINLYRQAGPSARLAMTLNDIAHARFVLSGKYARALTHLAEALQVAQDVGHPTAQAFALLTTADLYRDLGALEQAEGLLTQAAHISRQIGDGTLVNYTLLSNAQIRLRAGDVTEALALAAQARDHAQRSNNIYQLGLSYLTLGAARLAAGNPDEARTQVERGRELLAQSGARRDLTYAHMLLARVHQASGNVDHALSALDDALKVGIATQTFHYLIIEGQRVFDLLKLLLQHNPADRRPAEIMDRIRALPDITREVIGGLAPAALPHAPALRFYGFGTGKIEKNGRLIHPSVWRSALARYLVFYLLTHPPRNRDQITEIFWAEFPRGKAGSTFHWVKHQIGHALGRPLVIHEDGQYRVDWDPDCWFDISTFESLLDGQNGRLARLEEAIALYQGDFLEGYDAEWCYPIRERLRLRLLDALVELGEIHIAQEQFDRAFTALSRAVSADNLYEPASRALMRLYARDGRRHAALEHYHQLERRLQQELGTPPEPETRALYQTIQGAADPSRQNF